MDVVKKPGIYVELLPAPIATVTAPASTELRLGVDACLA